MLRLFSTFIRRSLGVFFELCEDRSLLLRGMLSAIHCFPEAFCRSILHIGTDNRQPLTEWNGIFPVRNVRQADFFIWKIHFVNANGFAVHIHHHANRDIVLSEKVLDGFLSTVFTGLRDKDIVALSPQSLCLTDSNLNHTGIYLYSKGKIMIHLTFDYKTDEKCTTPGQYLKYHRTFQGFTTRELAEKVGIVPATLVLYENDRHPIKHSTAVALANALGIDRNRLLDKYTAFVDYPYSSLLKKVRQELSLTQMQMAEVIGIGQTSYSGWEREIRVPRRKEYEKILAALKKLKVNVDIYLCHPAST